MSYFDTNETEQTFLIGQQWNGLYRDRYSYDRDVIIFEAVRAWRLNPLARQLADIYKIYNIDGLSYQCDDPNTKKFLDEFWNHDLNQVEDILEEISNELFLTGNLFPLYSTNSDGMTFVRIYPTDQIYEAKTADNDLRQELAYITRAVAMQTESKTFFNNSMLPVFMQHKTINRLAGTLWGEGEIWCDLPWLGRYASFLEDRVRLNRYRQAFMYDVTITGLSENQLKERRAEIAKSPPKSGSQNVHGNNEVWQVISPKLESAQAEHDLLALKKMIAVNHAPLHFLSEPESSTRTTADAAGTPTYKKFEGHQNEFKKIIKSMLQIAVKKRSEKDNKVSVNAKIEIQVGDATERDNASLALATSQIVSAIGDMFDREALPLSEYQRLVYRFMGETMPADLPKTAKKKPLEKATPPKTTLKTDSKSGEVTGQKE